MSDPQLSTDQLSELAAAIEARLEKMRADLRAGLHRAEDPRALSLANHLEETDDWAVADLQIATEIAEIERDLAEWRELQSARERLRDGTYGECLSCRERIPLARLRAWPAAARCVPCQEVVEKLAIQGGGAAPHSL